MPGYLSSISIPMLMYKEQKIIVIKTVIHLDCNFLQKSFESFHILFTIPIICYYRPVYGFVISHHQKCPNSRKCVLSFARKSVPSTNVFS